MQARVEARYLPPGFWGDWPKETRPEPSEDVTVDVQVEGTPGYYIPAKLHGRPDSWAPSEGEPAELHKVWLDEGEDIEPLSVDLLPHMADDARRELESALTERELDHYGCRACGADPHYLCKD